MSYSYDANGNRTSIASSTGYLANYAYDTLNRLTGVSYNSGSVASYAYTGVLNTGISYGNGVNTMQTFDGLLRLSSLAHTNGSGTIMSRTYAYDSVGNITSDGQKSYAYDTIDRLLSASALSGVTVPNSSEAFGYDVAGNRLSNTDTGGTTSYSGNILNQYLSLSGANNASYQYDNNGNIISNGVLSFGYDYKNRLVQVKKVTDSSVVAEYGYDVLGRRIQKLTSTTKTNFVYAGENVILETSTNLATSAKKNTSYINGNNIDDVLAYEYDDTTLSDADNPELLFCKNRVLPYQSEFMQYS